MIAGSLLEEEEYRVVFLIVTSIVDGLLFEIRIAGKSPLAEISAPERSIVLFSVIFTVDFI